MKSWDFAVNLKIAQNNCTMISRLHSLGVQSAQIPRFCEMYAWSDYTSDSSSQEKVSKYFDENFQLHFICNQTITLTRYRYQFLSQFLCSINVFIHMWRKLDNKTATESDGMSRSLVPRLFGLKPPDFRHQKSTFWTPINATRLFPPTWRYEEMSLGMRLAWVWD